MLSPLLHDLPGSFLKSPIRVESRKSSLRSNVVVVNLHGTYGVMHGSNGKYCQLAERVADSGFAHSVIYSSSRDWKKQESSDGSYESKMNIFRGKTFENELEDARKTVADIVKNAENRFGISPNDLKILLHGNSLWGILSFYLAAEFSQIRTIVTVGTGLRLATTDVPILSTFPDAEKVRGKISTFDGDFIMRYGTEDGLFAQSAFDDLFNSATNARSKSAVRYVGVDHAFKSRSGKPDVRIFENAVTALIEQLKNGTSKSETIEFEDWG